MNEAVNSEWLTARFWNRWRNLFAASLGVRLERKKEIYLGLSQAATVLDTSYWLQILFAAGVATLGLVLNSPAVIIGAMLISPLMGPILSGGLALATGDMILGLRTLLNLALSCLVAIFFSVLLVGLLPFKEMTAEIAARTQPNTLDLAVALFSGAIGSIATCKKVEGVVTSIPGVAIAVALMPPLCVVGYGIGVALSLNFTDGLRVAWGGGLLFLTNLVAITFTAMVVFLALHIDPEVVREEVRVWRQDDTESSWVRNLLMRFPLAERLRTIGSLRARFIMILVPLLLILIPLTQSLSQVRQEIRRQQEDNRLRRLATEIWQQNFGSLSSGEQRSYIDQLSVAEQEGRVTASLRVFTSQPTTASERAELTRLLAARLGRAPETVSVQLLEIPTTAGALAARAGEEKHEEAPPTVAQLMTGFQSGLDAAMRNLRLPAPAKMIDYRLQLSPNEPVQVIIPYLSDHVITADAQELITSDIRQRLAIPTLTARFEYEPEHYGPLEFARNRAVLPTTAGAVCDRVADVLRRRAGLHLTVITNREESEPEGLHEERAKTVIDYLAENDQLDRNRITILPAEKPGRAVMLQLRLAE